MKGLIALAVIGGVSLAGYYIYTTMEEEDSDDNGGNGNGNGTSPLDNYTQYTNQSLYQSKVDGEFVGGLGLSDLRKPDDYKNTRGVANCATWCNDNDDCKAFHVWDKNPDFFDDEETEPIQGICFYWSQDNSGLNHAKFSDGLSPGSEGKDPAQYKVDAYIKKGQDDITQSADAETYTGTVTHHNPFVNSLVNYMIW